MVEQPPERIIHVDVLVCSSGVFHHISPLFLEGKLFKKSRVFLLK